MVPQRPLSYADVEVELRRHGKVQECAVRAVQVGRRTIVTAYVVSSWKRVSPAELRAFLAGPRVPRHRIPRAVVQVRSLPRTDTGEVDYPGLPLPVEPDAVRARSGKAGGGSSGSPDVIWPTFAIVSGVAALLAFLMTDTFWPYSTDLSAVPSPYSGFFLGLYIAECLAFGLGIGVLVYGRRLLRHRGSPSWLRIPAHLALVWLLVAWWPQDNFYRLAAKTDWPRQAALVYGFNVTLMIAAVVLVAYLTAGAADRKR